MPKIEITRRCANAIRGAAINQFHETGRPLPNGNIQIEVDQEVMSAILATQAPGETISDSIERVILTNGGKAVLMRLVILESPFAGNVWQRWLNRRRYARKCMRDSLLRGESPMLSHLLYTQALDDAVPHERGLGIEAGLAWGSVADATVVYTDRGISRGMWQWIERAISESRPVYWRRLFGAA